MSFKSTGLVFKARSYIGSVEPPATVLEDESRFGNNGTFKGDGEPDWVQLPSGLWVLSFDGNDDIISVPNHSSLNFGTGDFTLFWWWKRTSAGTIGVYRGLLSKCVTHIEATPGWNITVSGTAGSLRLQIRGADGYVGLFGSISHPLDTWQCDCWIVSNDGVNTTATAIVNGVAQTPVTNTSKGSIDSTAPFRIYKGYQVVDNTGLMGKIIACNRALSVDRVASIFQAGRHWFGI